MLVVKSRVGTLLFQRRRIDAERADQAVRDFAVWIGAVDFQRAAVHEAHAIAKHEFVALGVATEIVVIFEDEDARAGFGLAIEIGGGKAADAAAYHHQVVTFLHAGGFAGGSPEIAVAQAVRRLEGALVAAA